MSDALKYLAEARPEAMGHYFKFLKASGGSLDPKTRALISVITKVAAQTEAGLRQYVNRALQAGCTADEILDAMLAAFPVLGLSRIVWAVDCLIAFDLPEFRAEALASPGVTEAWHDLGAVADFPPDAPADCTADGRRLLVRRSGAEFLVWDGRCPHQRTPIPLSLDPDGGVTCPRHGWRFDLTDGRCIAIGDRPLQALEARVQAGRVEAWW